MNKEEYNKLSDLDKVKYCIEESLKDHKKYKSQYWKGSAFMGESILQLIDQVKNFELTAVVQAQPEVCEHPFESVMSKCNGELNHCLKCGKHL